MLTKDFDYHLPKELIANMPVSPRDSSRLMCVNKGSMLITHHHFYDLPDLLHRNDVLVLNKSKVIPARIRFGNKEILLLRKLDENVWNAMVKPGRFFREHETFAINDSLLVNIQSVLDDGTRIIKFTGNFDLSKIGEPPFPPYIKNTRATIGNYQTIYADEDGSVAAPTAGLHFTNDLFDRLKKKGISMEFVTLHVGLGTFQPVKTEVLIDHKMHSEWFSLSKSTADRLNAAKKDGKRIIAVGTTSVRVLESCVENDILLPQSGETDIFIYPGYEFKYVDGIITNFHLPKSTLLMLVSAFAGKDLIMRAYTEAVNEKYRFYSFGDAMFLS